MRALEQEAPIATACFRFSGPPRQAPACKMRDCWSRNRRWVAPLQPQCTISAGAITVRSALAATRPAQAPLLLDFRKHAGTESTSCARVVLHLVRAFSHELNFERFFA